KISGIIQRISQLTWRHRLPQAETEVVSALNALLRGWGNYFCLGSVSKAYATVDAHTRHRLRQWLVHKHQIGGDWNKTVLERAPLWGTRSGPLVQHHEQPPV